MITRRELFAGGIGVAASPQLPKSLIRPARLRCEYLTNPLGMDERLPRLSWEIGALDAQSRGLKQTAWQILVASSEELLKQNRGDLWDSGRVESGESTHVVYAGAPLRSRLRCHWKVRVWDQRRQPTDWSAQALWTVGLLEPDDWGGNWIGLDQPAEAPSPWFPGAQWIWYPEGNPRQQAPLGPCYFLREFELPQGRAVQSAGLYLLADGQCRGIVNGTPAGEGGPVRTDMCWKRPPHLEVRHLLRPGLNILAIEAENTPGHFVLGELIRDSTPNPAGLIGILRVRFEDGSEWALVTDRHWRANRAAGTDWADQAGAGSTWPGAMELGPFGTRPWEKVTPDEYTTLPARMFRREFEVTRQLRRVTAYVCGLGYFDLFVNGRPASDHVLDPGMCEYDKKALYVTFDVTGHMRPGRNAAGILLGNGPFFAYRKEVPTHFRTFGYPKALLNLRLDYEDGSCEDIVTDGDWKVTATGPIRANNEYDGEVYDARMELRGWTEPGFDDTAWRAAESVDPPGGKLTARKHEPMRVTETLRPVSITEPQPGTFVADFGQTYNGWVRLNVSGPAGTTVRLTRGGILRADGRIRAVDSRSALMTDIYTLSGNGPETWTPRLTSQGGRYVEVTGFPGRPGNGSFEGLVVHTDMEPAGTFACSQELINRLCRNMRWTQRIEARSVPLDISSRDERMPWISEHHGMEGHGYLFNVAPMYTNWLQDIRLAQRRDGSIPNVAPAFWGFGQGVVWPSTLFYLPHWFYVFYGDERVIERSYPAMKRLVRFIRDAYLKADFTIDFNDHGDWLDTSTMDGKIPNDGRPHLLVGATPQPLISTAFYYFYCRLLEKHARRMRKEADAAQFASLGEKVREGFLRRFFDARTKSYTSRTQTSYVLPLAFGLVREEHKAAVVGNLAEDVMKTHDGHPTVGFMGAQWLLTVLSENGRHDTAYKLITQTTRPSWGYMVSRGATTMWERWDHDTADPGMTGESQYFMGADIVGWLFRSLAGIGGDAERPGFRHLVLRPLPAGDLKWVKASFRSLYGPITSEWEIGGTKLAWRVVVPPNTSATAYVPTTDAAAVTESGKPAATAAGVRFSRTEGRAAVYELEAGSYRFEAPWS